MKYLENASKGRHDDIFIIHKPYLYMYQDFLMKKNVVKFQNNNKVFLNLKGTLVYLTEFNKNQPERGNSGVIRRNKIHCVDPKIP